MAIGRVVANTITSSKKTSFANLIPFVSVQYPQDVGAAGNTLIAISTQSVTHASLYSGGGGALDRSQNVPSIGEISDDQGNKWRFAYNTTSVIWTGTPGGGLYGIDVWICESCLKTGTPPTVMSKMLGFSNINGVNGMQIALLEYSGFTGYNLVDTFGASGSITGTSSGTWYTNYPLSSANDFIINVITGNTTTPANVVKPSGYTSIIDTSNNNGTNLFMAHRSAPSAVPASSSTWTGLTGATESCALTIALQPVGDSSSTMYLVQSCYREPPLLMDLSNPLTSQVFPGGVTAGNTLFVQTYTSSVGSDPISTVTDTANNNWFRLDTRQGAQWWWCQDAVASPTYTTTANVGSTTTLATLGSTLPISPMPVGLPSSGGGDIYTTTNVNRPFTYTGVNTGTSSLTGVTYGNYSGTASVVQGSPIKIGNQLIVTFKGTTITVDDTVIPLGSPTAGIFFITELANVPIMKFDQAYTSTLDTTFTSGATNSHTFPHNPSANGFAFNDNGGVYARTDLSPSPVWMLVAQDVSACGFFQMAFNPSTSSSLTCTMAGYVVYDGNISSGTLTCTTSTPFSATDVGKNITITGAGAAGADYYGSISAYTNSSTVHVTPAVSTTVTNDMFIFGNLDPTGGDNGWSMGTPYAWKPALVVPPSAGGVH